jgi:hypothetical protein
MLKNNAIFSINKLCQAGCNVIFNDSKFTVLHKGKEIMKRKKNKSNGIWYIPLIDSEQERQILNQKTLHTWQAAYTT